MTNKKILTIFYAVYASAIVALLGVPRAWMPEFYRPMFMAGISTVGMLLVALPGWIFRTQDARKKMVVERSQLAIAFSIFVNGLGGLGLYKLYKIGIPYDKILHFFLPAIFIVSITYFLLQWYGRSRRFAISFAVVSVLVGGIAWEGFEVAQDKLFGTKTAGVYGADYERDTTLDIFADIGGSILGAYLVMKENKKVI